MMPRRAVAEAGGGNKRETVGNKPEIKAESDAAAMEPETKPDIEISAGWQWSPAAISVGIPPGDPSRPPGVIRKPNPAISRAAMPPAIMERSPAPGIIGLPIPAAIGPEPAPAITVRPPARVHDGHGRSPAPAECRHFDPGAIGGERLIKIIVVHLLNRRRDGVSVGVWRRGFSGRRRRIGVHFFGGRRRFRGRPS